MGEHILYGMNWDLFRKSLYDVKTATDGRDRIAYNFYLGVDEKSGLPMGVYGNFSYTLGIKNIDFIHKNIAETKILYPAAVVLDGQTESLISEPILCSDILKGYRQSHTAADTLRQFDELRLDFINRKIDDLLEKENPARFIVNNVTPFAFAAIG